MSQFAAFKRRMVRYGYLHTLLPLGVVCIFISLAFFLAHSLVGIFLTLGLGILFGLLTAFALNTYLAHRLLRVYDKALADIPLKDHPDDAQKHWQKSSCFLLIAYDSLGRLIGVGTAFAWDERTLVTCAHCVEIGVIFRVISHADGEVFFVQSVNKACDPELDLAFLRLKTAHNYPLLLRKNEPPQTDMPLWTLDFRFQGSFRVLDTLTAYGMLPSKINRSYPLHVGYFHGYENPETNHSTATAYAVLMPGLKGMSGSPIMEGSHVVGMLFAGSRFVTDMVPMHRISEEAEKLPPPC